MEISINFVDELKELRHEFHSQPELSNHEQLTALKVITQLKQLHPTKLISGIGGYGILAIFDSGSEGPKVLFRAELDALPIQETNTFNYTSCTPGCSHKCGHDGHLTTVLGVARLIAKNKPKRGMVMVLFQPAEETGSGAQAVIDDPAFQEINPDYVFAYHNVPGYPLGQIVLRHGSITASVRSIIIKLYGHTSHAG